MANHFTPNPAAKGATRVACFAVSPILRAYLWRSGADHLLSFSPVDFGSYIHGMFVRTNFMLKQDLVSVHRSMDQQSYRMNHFAYDYGKRFAAPSLVERLQTEILEHGHKRDGRCGTLHLVGMGIGGLLALSFYFFLTQTFTPVFTRIVTFGSPRLGDSELREWFRDCIKHNLLLVTNYCSVGPPRSEGALRDPQCSFPPGEGYVDNDLVFFRNFQHVEHVAEEQPHSAPSLRAMSATVTGGMDAAKMELWLKLHTIQAYSPEFG